MGVYVRFNKCPNSIDLERLASCFDCILEVFDSGYYRRRLEMILDQSASGASSHKGLSFFFLIRATRSNFSSLIPARRSLCESLEFSWRALMFPFFFVIFLRVFSKLLGIVNELKNCEL